MLDAWLNDSKSSRETREMKGRDSPFGDTTPYSTCASFSPSSGCHPAAFCSSRREWEEFQGREIMGGGLFLWAGAGCRDATPEPPALGKKREGTRARSMTIEGWRAKQDWREIWG